MNEDLLSDDPQDLLNQPLDFKVKISSISNLPEDFCKNVYCEYEFYMDKTKYTTPVCHGKNQAPQFDYSRQHHVNTVTQMLINYLLSDKMTIKIYGNQDLKKKQHGKLSSASLSTMKSSSISSGKNDMMNTDPLTGMKGSYKNTSKKSGGIVGRLTGGRK